MAAKIRVLDDILADQIAAGEVVERPASVVKELLENAIDAGAAAVHVTIDQGGSSLIRVADDGCGMGPEDAALCVQRHATSKLRSPDDLFAIQTLGFRGEALPSIASVSRLRLTTRHRDDESGTELSLEGGQLRAPRPIGCAPGTAVEVRDLFYNVPARLKFLKAKATESGHVAGICTRIALAYPQLHLTLTRDGRLAKEFLPHVQFDTRVQEIFPGEHLHAFEFDVDDMRVSAVLGPPERARNGAVALHVFVNGRAVKDIALARAVAFAYGSVLPPGRFPIGAVKVQLPPAQLDVNVHPQKNEVRFTDSRARLEALTRALAKRLGTSAFRGPAARPKDYWQERLPPGPRIADADTRPERGPTAVTTPPGCGRPSPSPLHGAGQHTGVGYGSAVARITPPATHRSVGDPPVDPFQIDGQVRPDRAKRVTGVADALSSSAVGAPTSQKSLALYGAREEGTPPPSHTSTMSASAGEGPATRIEETPSAPADLPPSPSGACRFFSSLRYIGQARQTLLLCEGEDRLYMIDQHAADERVRYARMRAAYAAGTVKTQRLLFPERVEVSDGDGAQIDDFQDAIARTGLECTRLGPTTVAVHAVPVLLQRASATQLLSDLLAELQGKGERVFGDAVDMAIATMACHASIRAGDPLQPEEAIALLRALDEVQDFGGHCPHGRPIAFDLPFSDLLRKLGR